MKPDIYCKFKNFKVLAFLFVALFISATASAQWIVYDGSTHPLDNEEIAFSHSNLSVEEEVFNTWNTVVDDPEVPGNKLLQFIDDAAGQRGMWKVAVTEATSKLTLVARIKPYDMASDWTLDIDFDLGGKREQVFIQNDGQIRLRRGANEYYPLPDGFDQSVWHTYRFVMDTEANTFTVYIDENEAFFTQTAPADAGTNSYFRFSNGDNNRTVSYIMDWMIWDESGAYAPGEGLEIPSELFPKLSYWTVFDASVLPLESTDIGFSRSNVSVADSIFDTWTSIIDDTEIAGNKLMQFNDNAAGQRGMWRVILAEETTQLTMITRIKALDMSLDWTIDMDIDFGGKREQVFIQNDGQIRFRRGANEYYPFPEGFVQDEWYLFRFVMDTESNLFSVYLNETRLFMAQAAPADAGSNRYFRFGTGDTNKSSGYVMDWLIWDETGAFAPGEGAAIPSELSVNPLDESDAALLNLFIDGEAVVGFDSEILNYNVERPSGLALPVITATTNSTLASKRITQATAVPGTASIEVTARDGVTKQTYTFNFTEVAATNDATLNNISFNGEPMDGFNAQVTQYNVVLPYGTTTETIPQLSAVPNIEGAVVEIVQATSLPGNATITVTALDGETTQVYTLTFTVAEPSADATLSALLVNDVTVEAFHPDTLYYTVTLPSTTQSIQVSAMANSNGATVEILNPADNIFNIVVTAQDGTSTLTYYLRTIIAEEVVSEWTVYEANELPAAFNPNFAESNGTAVQTTLVTDDLDETNTWLQLITEQVGQTGMWRMDFGGQLPTQAATIVFRVKAANDVARRVIELDVQQGGFRERVYLNREANAVRLNESIGGGDGGEIPMPEGQTVSDWHIYRLAKDGDQVRLFVDENEVPIAQGTSKTSSKDDYFRIGGGNSSHNIGAHIDWVIWDRSGAYAPGEGTAIPDYLNIQVGPPPTGKDASLADLSIGGSTIEDFSALTFEYEVILPHGSTFDDVPVVNAVARIAEAGLTIVQPDALPGTATITVSSTDGTVVNVYTVSFRAATNDATLSNLMVDGVTVDAFDPSTTNYTVELPQGTKLIPVVTAVLTDQNASRVITQAPQLPGDATVVVTAEDGQTVITYTVSFELKTTVDELDALNVQLYPNPVSNTLGVQLAGKAVNSEVKLMNTSGQVIRSLVANTNNVSIDVSALSNGVYLLSVSNGDEKVIKRFVKK